MSEGAGRHKVLIEDDAIGAIDGFALVYRLPNGKTVLDQFLASWPDLSVADRDLLRGWRGPVDGIFEIRGRDVDSLIVLNLVDDLEYRTYSNMGPAAFRPLPKRGFVCPSGSHPPGPRRGCARVPASAPTRPAGKRYADVLRAETIGPLPLRRLAAAYPQTVDALFWKILGQSHFTWTQRGDALLCRRKPWYYEHETRPGIAVIGARLSELIGR